MGSRSIEGLNRDIWREDDDVGSLVRSLWRKAIPYFLLISRHTIVCTVLLLYSM